VEFNLILPCCDGPACRYEFSPAAYPEVEADAAAGLGSAGELQGVNAVDLIDSFTGVMLTIESGVSATLWRFPVYTVSLSESGFEKIYQGSCLAFLFDLSSSDETLEFNNRFKVTARKYV
jgi:alpha-amylase